MATTMPQPQGNEDLELSQLSMTKRPGWPLADADADGWDVESSVSTDLPATPSPAVEIDDDDESDAMTCEDTLNFAPEQTFLIFDWDDTILPTCWLSSQGLNLQSTSAVVSNEQKMELAVLARWAAETLKVAKALGTVVIVTNAEDRWIQLSCEKFLPSLSDSLTDVKILSARSTYEPLGFANPSEWKIHAFEREIDLFCQSLRPGQCANIVSIGDSQHEREALFHVTSMRSACRSKSVKFNVRPTLEALTREQEALCDELPDIVDQDDDLDLVLPQL